MDDNGNNGDEITTAPDGAAAEATARTALKWIDEGEDVTRGGEHWFSAISSIAPTDNDSDSAFEFRVYPSGDDSNKWMVANSDDELLGSGIAPEFDSAEAAQQWCEDRDASLLASMKAETPSPEADTPGTASAGDIAEHVPDANQWHEIQKARHRERECEVRVASLSEELKWAKKSLESSSEQLGRLIDEGANPTLFTGVKPSVNVDTGAAQTEVTVTAPEAWRSVPLTDIGLDGKIVAKLAEFTPSLTTLGELADFSSGEFRRLTDIPGIGPAKAEAIEEALMAYYAAHPIDKAAPVAVLKWEPYDEVTGTIHAHNTAGMADASGDVYAFYVDPADGKFDVGGSDSQLMPDENPGDFDTLDASKQWAEDRNAQLVANAARLAEPVTTPPEGRDAADFDDDKLGIPEIIVAIDRKLRIEVSHRAGGTWASSWFAGVVSNVNATKLEGRHPSREAAITAAADGAHEWLRGLQLRGPAAKQRKEVIAELDKLDKAIGDAPGGARDDNSQAMKQELQTA